MNPNNVVFVLGLGRSGTSLVINLLSQCSVRKRVLIEPLSKYDDILENGGIDLIGYEKYGETKKYIKHKISSLLKGDMGFCKEYYDDTVLVNDNDYNYILLKEVHKFFYLVDIFKEYTNNVFIVVRNEIDIIDSLYAKGYNPRFKYLEKEIDYLKYLINGGDDFIGGIREIVDGMSWANRQVLKNLSKKHWLCKLCCAKIVNEYLINKVPPENIIKFEDLLSGRSGYVLKHFERIGLSYNGRTIEDVDKFFVGDGDGYYEVRKNSDYVLSRKKRFLYGKRYFMAKVLDFV